MSNKTAEPQAEQPSALFDSIYAASKSTLDALKKPLIKRKLKRKYESAFDSAEGQLIAAEAEMQKAREDLDAFDVNMVINTANTVKAAKDTMDSIKKDFLQMFGEEMKER